MKTVQTRILVFFLLIGVQGIYSQEYQLNLKKSSLSWTGKAAFNSYALQGTIKPKEGAILIDDGIITNLTIVMNMRSIDHENKELKNHLKNEDFFEVKKYPKATFYIENTAVIQNKKSSIKGKLTIKGKTNTENIPITIEQTDATITITFNQIINRTKYGVNHNSPSIFKRMKENAIADEFTLEGTLVFIK